MAVSTEAGGAGDAGNDSRPDAAVPAEGPDALPDTGGRAGDTGGSNSDSGGSAGGAGESSASGGSGGRASGGASGQAGPSDSISGSCSCRLGASHGASGLLWLFASVLLLLRRRPAGGRSLRRSRVRAR
jgi:hypothetical protein